MPRDVARETLAAEHAAIGLDPDEVDDYTDADEQRDDAARFEARYGGDDE